MFKEACGNRIWLEEGTGFEDFHRCGTYGSNSFEGKLPDRLDSVLIIAQVVFITVSEQNGTFPLELTKKVLKGNQHVINVSSREVDREWCAIKFGNDLLGIVELGAFPID